ncbi:hypothetical protein PAXRUDRAFT_830929 [Paxillus rubicundulus Ve08.2h10]|uniref:Uncharacterized protein n=1 Tax=Paxillus rubicundulus Ve08.2h10 TaxID=930991 RepID=A0A0D0DSU1_9AGAM|nr:hypothetical protein PAXRUDRAFT_830929 [Paxillus rubicundulus Ve08.2h10]
MTFCATLFPLSLNSGLLHLPVLAMVGMPRPCQASGKTCAPLPELGPDPAECDANIKEQVDLSPTSN